MKGIDVKDERGFILILALVTMVAMTVIGLSLIMNITVDMQLSRNERESKQAFQLADGGINEAISRLALSSAQGEYIGELAGDANYRLTAWNANNSLGRDFGIGVGGDRESADSLDYSVTIRYLNDTNTEIFCDSDDTGPNTSVSGALTYPSTWTCVNATPEVVMYGRDFMVPETLTEISYGKQPVYRVTSTGTSGTTLRTIEAYIGASSLNTDTEGAINTNGCITVSGGPSITITGGVKEGGFGGCGTCDDGFAGCGAKGSVDDMDKYLGEDLSAIINMADEKHQCLDSASCADPGDDIPSSGMIDGVVTDWGDFAGDSHSTMIYINNAGGKAAQISGTFQGRGILIVSGDLELTGGLEYEGLVYVLGTLTISGGGSGLNVTGGIMANSTVAVNGSITATYDQSTLESVAKENSSSAIMIWKRL